MEPERVPPLAGNSDSDKEIKWKKSFLLIDDLTFINGVGQKTVEELKEYFPDMKTLVTRLKSDEKFFIDNFRDDVVEKMKNALF